jgi:hypothetical protein
MGVPDLLIACWNGWRVPGLQSEVYFFDFGLLFGSRVARNKSLQTGSFCVRLATIKSLFALSVNGPFSLAGKEPGKLYPERTAQGKEMLQ